MAGNLRFNFVQGFIALIVDFILLWCHCLPSFLAYCISSSKLSLGNSPIPLWISLFSLFNSTVSSYCLHCCHHLLIRRFQAITSLISGKSLMASWGLLTFFLCRFQKKWRILRIKGVGGQKSPRREFDRR